MTCRSTQKMLPIGNILVPKCIKYGMMLPNSNIFVGLVFGNRDFCMVQHVVTSMDELGSLVRLYRKKQGLTQDDVALMSNVGRRFVIELEQGKSTLQISKVLQVLQSLGVGLLLQVGWDEDIK